MGKEIILVVDNDSDFCRDLEAIKPPGMEIGFLSSARQAVEFVCSGKCSAVVMGQNLADGDGLHFLRQFKTLQPLLPVVLCTSHPTKSLILEAVHSGAFDVIEKPAAAAELVCMLERLGRLFCTSGVKTGGSLDQGGIGNRRLTSVLQIHTGSVKSWLFSHFHGAGVSQQFPDSRKPPAEISVAQVKDSGAQVLEVQFLGPLRVFYCSRERADWPGHKAKLLFAYLCYHHRQRICRDVLMDKFWPYAGPDSARNCLNVTMHTMRRWLQQRQGSQEFICFRDEYYFFHPELIIHIDTEEFVNYWRQAQEIERKDGEGRALSIYEAAAALYRGDFIEDHPYESWTELERENYREIYLSILNKVSRLYSLDGKPERAIDLCQTILEKDKAREDIHRRVMRCYYRLGQRDKAMKQYFKCIKALKSELDMQPSSETELLFTRIKNSEVITTANKE